MRTQFSVTVLLILLSISVQAGSMEEIKIINSEFETIKTINTPDELTLAKVEWEKLKPLDDLPNYNWTHKIDISSGSSTKRWLYNKEGYVALLTKTLKPAYKVKDVNAFNKVYLGL